MTTIEHDQRQISAFPDPISFIPRILTKLNSIWLKKTYSFFQSGHNFSIHYTCDILRRMAPNISLGDQVYIAPHVWLNVASTSGDLEPRIIIGDRCGIGRRSTISAKNRIVLQKCVLLAPSVLIMDHNHEYSDITRAISEQGVTLGGTITIEENCWLGYNAVVLSTSGDLTIGRNSVIGANSVVTRSFPPYSIIAGNPAKLVRKYDLQFNQWMRMHG